jgi:hypothetical protein
MNKQQEEELISEWNQAFEEYERIRNTIVDGYCCECHVGTGIKWRYDDCPVDFVCEKCLQSS